MFQSKKDFFVALVDSIEEEFHAHFFSDIAPSKLIVFVLLSFGGLVAHGTFFTDSFLKFILLFLKVFFHFLKGFERCFFAIRNNLFDGFFGIELCMFEFLLGMLFGHDDFGGFAFEDLFNFGFGEEHLHSSLVDFVLVVASLIIKLDGFLLIRNEVLSNIRRVCRWFSVKGFRFNIRILGQGFCPKDDRGARVTCLTFCDRFWVGFRTWRKTFWRVTFCERLVNFSGEMKEV